jgi:hypothetical protein
VKRGTCATCWNRTRLRKDGTVGAHQHGGWPGGGTCEGTGKPPPPSTQLSECRECTEFYWGTPRLMEAIWSVAIESPKSGEQLAWEFLQGYHENGHLELEAMTRETP